MYFTHMYESRTMKPIEIIFRRHEEGWAKGVKVNQSTLYKYMEKSQWNPFVQLIYATKKWGSDY
jgi:hypothetical protein